MDKLTQKQEIFCQEYIKDFNATRATIEAGYSKKTAKEIGSKNLTKVNIATRLQELMKDRQERTEITQDMVVKELAKIAFFDIGNVFDGYALKEIDQLPEEVRRAISSIKVREEKGDAGQSIAEIKEFRANDKLKAIELLGKHLGMFVDKQEITHQGQLQVYRPEKRDDN